MHIFVVGHPADRGLMHLNIFRNIPEDEGLEILNSLIQKVLLKLDDAFGHLVDRPLALINAPDQPECGTQLLLNIFPVRL